jgi:GTP-binding protein HflX
LRALTESDVHVEDKMFATLDPVSRRLRFPREREVIITDTVGFIRDLPRELMAAFKATLEELSDASLLLHVVDVASPDLERRMVAVRKILDDLELGDAPELLVFNQADRLPPGEAEAIAERLGGVAVSALEKRGLAELLTQAEKLLWSRDDLAGVRRHAEDLAAAGG